MSKLDDLKALFKELSLPEQLDFVMWVEQHDPTEQITFRSETENQEPGSFDDLVAAALIEPARENTRVASFIDGGVAIAEEAFSFCLQLGHLDDGERHMVFEGIASEMGHDRAAEVERFIEYVDNSSRPPETYRLDLRYCDVVRVRVEYDRGKLALLLRAYMLALDGVRQMRADGDESATIMNIEYGSRETDEIGVDYLLKVEAAVLTGEMRAALESGVPLENEQGAWLMNFADRVTAEQGKDAKKFSESGVPAWDAERLMSAVLDQEIALIIERAMFAALNRAEKGDVLQKDDYIRVAFLPPPGIKRLEGHGGRRQVKRMADQVGKQEAKRFWVDFEKRYYPLMQEAYEKLAGKGRRKPEAVTGEALDMLRKAGVDQEYIDMLVSQPPRLVAAEICARKHIQGYVPRSTPAQLDYLIEVCEKKAKPSGARRVYVTKGIH